jgi:hypothetical protein
LTDEITICVMGIPARILCVNQETGNSLIVFRGRMQDIPTVDLIRIMDEPKPEEIAGLVGAFGFLRGNRAADPPSLGWSGPGPFFKPTIGNLWRKPRISDGDSKCLSSAGV